MFSLGKIKISVQVFSDNSNTTSKANASGVGEGVGSTQAGGVGDEAGRTASIACRMRSGEDVTTWWPCCDLSKVGLTHSLFHSLTDKYDDSLTVSLTH